MIRKPLSPYQRDIWVAAAQFPESNQYTLFCYDRLVGEVDEQALRHAMASVARRTDAFGLRLGEEDGEPFQWLAAELDVSITTLDLTHEYDPDADIQAWLRNAFGFSYALDGNQLADLFLLRASDSTYVYVRAHHVVCDAWGLQYFMGQVRDEYLRLTANAVTETQTQATSFLAVIEADDYTQLEPYREDRAYFSQVLSGVEPALFSRKLAAGARSNARYSITLERPLLATIRDRGESPFLFLSAAIALYLARVHQRNELVLGIPVLNRADRRAKAVVGHFANTLPLRVEIIPGQHIEEFVAQLRQGIRTLLRHQRVPLGDVAKGSAPLFDTTISYMRWPKAVSIPGVTCETVAQTHAHDQDALAIWVSEFDDHSDVQVDFEYACDVFDEDFTMEAAAKHVAAIAAMVIFALFGQIKAVAIVALVVIGLTGVSMNPALITRGARVGHNNMLVNSVHTACIMLGVMAGSWIGGWGIAAGLGLQGALWVGAGLGVLALFSLLPELRTRASQSTFAR